MMQNDETIPRYITEQDASVGVFVSITGYQERGNNTKLYVNSQSSLF